MEREEVPKPTDLKKELKQRKDQIKQIVMGMMIFANVLYHILLHKADTDFFMTVRNTGYYAYYGFIPGFIFGLLPSIPIIRALKRYISALQDQDYSEVYDQGKIYYSIKRKGIMGLDGQGFKQIDLKQIEIDIEHFSTLG